MTFQKPEDTGAPLDAAEEISKSQRKREAHDIFLLARELVEMKASTLKKILSSVDLDEDIIFEITKARKIKSHGARKRETMFLSKQLRQLDLDSLRMAIEQPKEFAREEALRQHRLEIWRDSLIATGDPMVNHLCALNHDFDRQQLRQLVRNARREAAHKKPPAAARSLFRLLAEFDLQEELPTIPGAS
ncbi:MAG: DUF615 domain-containing protein [Xanthomonadales bacterium]|nr:DUF615 domain-containing protein [Xanthomonadales bacterium]